MNYSNEEKENNEKILTLDAKKFTKILERKFNLESLHKNFREIFSEKISTKYSTINPDHNIKLIQKIYQTKTEKNVITLLDSTFLKCLNVFRKNINIENKNNEDKSIADLLCCDINDFICNIFEEAKNETNRFNYLKKVILICYNYEYCFQRKFSRKKSQKEN